ncbi:putative IS200/IS605 family transposase ISNph16 [Pillotina sp. SPG140]
MEVAFHVRTIKALLPLSEEQKTFVLDTIKHAAQVFALFVQLANEHHSTSYNHLHKFGYTLAKTLSPNLPTALLQATAQQALACVKSWNSNHITQQWKYRGTKKAQQLSLNKLCLSRRGNLTTFSSVGGRIRVLHAIPAWFVNRYHILTNDVQAGQLKYHIRKNVFYLCLQYRVQPQQNHSGKAIIGIDRGLYNLVTLSDGTNISSKACKTVKRRYAYNRSKLQSVGTRSAKRKLKRKAGKEKRYMTNCNHCITKRLAANIDVQTYVLEDLTGIRKQKNKGKKFNSWLSNWSFSQFEQQLKYKCELHAIHVVNVDPRYTSQKCNRCGTIDKSSRNKSRYVCKHCGHRDHADVNAAKNIRDKYARSKQSGQAAFNQPIVEAITTVAAGVAIYKPLGLSQG